SACSFLTRSFFVFFFSSRRRHTRSKRDWSSDVCSSDLPRLRLRRRAQLGRERLERLELVIRERRHPPGNAATVLHGDGAERVNRSEERRVGKEGRARWSTDRERKERATRDNG